MNEPTPKVTLNQSQLEIILGLALKDPNLMGFNLPANLSQYLANFIFSNKQIVAK
jgi:hypothetical protein